MEDKELMIFICTMQIAILALYTAWKVKKSKHAEYDNFATLFSELKEDPDLFFIFVSFQLITCELNKLASKQKMYSIKATCNSYCFSID
ncbi:hypothetical protein ACFW04_014784 [Cataglyphis niger]